MRYTGRTRAPVPADDTCDDSASTVEGSISEVTLTSSASGAKLIKTSNAKLVKNKLPKCTYTSDAKVPASKRPCTGLNMAADPEKLKKNVDAQREFIRANYSKDLDCMNE